MHITKIELLCSRSVGAADSFELKKIGSFFFTTKNRLFVKKYVTRGTVKDIRCCHVGLVVFDADYCTTGAEFAPRLEALPLPISLLPIVMLREQLKSVSGLATLDLRGL